MGRSGQWWAAFVAAACIFVGTPDFFAGAQSNNGDAPSDDVAAPSRKPDGPGGPSFEALSPMICSFHAAAGDETISCGLLSVSENRADQNARHIRLRYVKLAARRPARWRPNDGAWRRRTDPVLYMGPRGDLGDAATRIHDHPVRDVRDVYIIEARADRLVADFCPDAAYASRAARRERATAQDAAATRCAAHARAGGADLDGYSLEQSARDLRDLRTALRLKEWSIWASNDALALARVYAAADAGGVRAAVFDDARARPRAFPHLNAITTRCAADPRCAAAYPDLAARLHAAMKALDAAPVAAEPLDHGAFPDGEAQFFASDLAAFAAPATGGVGRVAHGPALLDALADAAERRDARAFRLLTAPWAAPAASGHLSAPTIFTVDRTAENAETPAVRTLMFELRAATPDGASEPLVQRPEAHVSVVAAPFSTQGAPSSTRRAFGAADCAGAIMTRFFDEPDSPLDATCLASISPPRFTSPLYRTNGPLRLSLLKHDAPRAAAFTFAWGAASAAMLVIAAIIYALAPIARGMNGFRAMPTGGARPLAWATATLGGASALGLAAAAQATHAAEPRLFVAGLVGWAEPFAYGALTAAALAVALCYLSIKARIVEPLPVGVTLGLALTAVSALAFGAFTAVWVVAPL